MFDDLLRVHTPGLLHVTASPDIQPQVDDSDGRDDSSAAVECASQGDMPKPAEPLSDMPPPVVEPLAAEP